jgi:hypothetical protein
MKNTTKSIDQAYLEIGRAVASIAENLSLILINGRDDERYSGLMDKLSMLIRDKEIKERKEISGLSIVVIDNGPPRLCYKLRELKNFTGLSTDWWRQRHRNGDLKTRYAAGSVVVLASDLAEYLNGLSEKRQNES